MSNYKDKLYTNYVSTHVVPRKGIATLDEFKWRSAVYQKQFGKFLPKDKNSKIIDIGCGNGSVAWWLQQNGYTNTEGIDISAEQIEVARRLGVKNVKEVDIKEYLKDAKSSYNVIFARDVIEHFIKDEILQILDICYNSLKDNGILILQVPNAESPFSGRIRYGDFTHEIAFTSSSLSQVLRTVGFNNIKTYSVEPIIYGLKSSAKFVLWKFFELIYKLLLFAEIGRGRKIVSQDIIAVAKK